MSGRSNDNPFSALMTVLMPVTTAEIIRLMKPMMPLTAVLITFVILSQTVLTVLPMACQAASQLPRNTALKKSASPRSTTTARSMASAIAPTATPTTSAMALNTSANAGPNVAMIHLATGASRLFHRSSRQLATLATSKRMSSHRGLRWEDQRVDKICIRLVRIGCKTFCHRVVKMPCRFSSARAALWAMGWPYSAQVS